MLTVFKFSVFVFRATCTHVSLLFQPKYTFSLSNDTSDICTYPSNVLLAFILIFFDCPLVRATIHSPPTVSVCSATASFWIPFCTDPARPLCTCDDKLCLYELKCKATPCFQRRLGLNMGLSNRINIWRNTLKKKLWIMWNCILARATNFSSRGWGKCKALTMWNKVLSLYSVVTSGILQAIPSPSEDQVPLRSMIGQVVRQLSDKCEVKRVGEYSLIYESDHASGIVHWLEGGHFFKREFCFVGSFTDSKSLWEWFL